MGRKAKKNVEQLENKTETPIVENKKSQFEGVDSKKIEKVKKTLNEINNKLGGTFLNYASTIEEVKRLPFKHKILNDLTGGGVPFGRTTCIYGSKGCGKSSIAYELAAEGQKMGKIVLYADIERSFSPERAKMFGVDVDSLIYGAFYNAEQPMDAIIALCKEKAADIIIIDSIQGLSPKAEQETAKGVEKSVEDDSMALLARKLSQFFRMAIPYVDEAKAALILIGQSRLDLGGFIKLERLSGGHALLHNCRLILKTRRGSSSDAPTEKVLNPETGKKEEVLLGFDAVISVEKSQISGCIEGRDIHIPYLFEKGFDCE